MYKFYKIISVNVKRSLNDLAQQVNGKVRKFYVDQITTTNTATNNNNNNNNNSDAK